MKKLWIGIDNGVSGSIGWVGEYPGFVATPVFRTLSYQKSKARHINRIETATLSNLLQDLKIENDLLIEEVLVILERPMVNPKMLQSSVSALRALEATLITVEELELPYQYCDSKEWQKELLPSGIKGSANLKRASAEIGTRLYPSLSQEIERQKDADGILIAEWAKRKNL